ncbi:hypothetical protein OG618_37770 (plasmid) [Kitasatospora sp. NBC_01246]|uniref:hypothetical protein n=1 Tax=Kitasatospora sp. NBC_01246 TaxID=2903570 RepID=UPI002E348630|nr:hypothetical protein [Kitasatospora sp. NBC_01246]
MARWFARPTTALAGPLIANGSKVACPKCGSVTNHRLTRPKRHTESQARIHCSAGHEFTHAAVPAEVVTSVRYNKEGKFEIEAGRGEAKAKVTGVLAKDSMAKERTGGKGKQTALQKAAAAKAPAAAPVRRPAGGGGTLAATINLAAATVGTVGQVAGAVAGTAQAVAGVAQAAATTTAAVSRPVTEAIATAKEGVKVGGQHVQGRVKLGLADRSAAAAQAARSDGFREKEAQRAAQAAEKEANRQAKATEAEAKRSEAATIRWERAAERATVRVERAARPPVRKPRRPRKGEQPAPSSPPAVDLSEFS